MIDIKIPADHVSIKREPTAEEIELVMQYGRRYQPAALPPDIERGPVGWCYDTSMLNAIEHQGGKYRYVEGLARLPGDKKWILHAWLTDGRYAYDPTWRATNGRGEEIAIPKSAQYIGLEIPLLAAVLFNKATGYQGIIPNRHLYPYTLESVIAGMLEKD